jgi:hypothetical protein
MRALLNKEMQTMIGSRDRRHIGEDGARSEKGYG